MEKQNILLVDDRPENLIALEALLEGPELNIIKATSGNEALSLVLEFDFALVLLDVQMPDMDGFETAELMRGIEKCMHIPIIFVTAISKEQEHVFRGYQSGAVDYLFKPLDPDIMKSKVNIFLDLDRQKRLIESQSLELKKTLEELKNTQAQMLMSEKMASVGQLAAGVAHEINNPTGFVSSNLSTLSGYHDDIDGLIKEYRKLIGILKSASNLSPPIGEQMKVIKDLETEADVDFILSDVTDLIKDCREGTERIKKIVLDLKDFAHPGEDKLQAADINKGIESTLNVVWNELKYKATVKKDYGVLPVVKCYPQQLNQVFMNIFVNAAQAIEEHGKITISTSADDEYVEIRISDNGTGIAEENLSKLFDPFFTTKEVGSGTGLGLNVAYNIIQKHNGSIDVESEVGKGTTFRIRIPVDG